MVWNAAVAQSIKEDPNKSNRHLAQQFQLRLSTFWKILRKILGLRRYKIQPVREL